MSDLGSADESQYELHDNVLVVHALGKAFNDAVDLERKNRSLARLEEINRRDDVRVVIFDFNLEQMDRQSYLDFFAKNADVHTNRFCNMLIQTAEVMARSPKFTIHLGHGNMVAAFLSLSMFCDYRIASQDTVYYTSYREMDATPLGGLPYFLGGRLGRGKAYEMLLLKDEITAQEAYDLGLVDRLVPEQGRLDQALDLAKQFAAVGANTLTGVKQLINRSITGLQEYLEFEKKVFLKRFCM